MTKVINIKDAPKDWKTNPDYVYIGRAGKGLSGYWGNPFELTNEAERANILKVYIQYIQARLLRKELLKLKDKTLVCFCVPKLCHGHILALLADVL